MGVLSNKIDKQLKPGDHIYSWRQAYIHAHHGIYDGEGMVIHFIRGPGQNRFLSCSSSSLLVLLMAFRAQYVERKQELKVASVPVWIVFSLVDIYSYLSMQCQLYFFLAKAR
ncbi:hypothetical protein GLYMA_18G047100v4 [Glycine max]|uniref:LRAT domain-containing protein n=2 Tax=Glycine subgen. Soja TaxID=1462606 RepID=A0A0R0EW56_SOYBN|nr:hypothetical protein GYH30_049043 [Glycine max]KRG98047.1 hypothetical protein GLYMA_18G047100v4 [Glycine max]RZB50690.1 hypothetical protein D0Y65_047533 [Glycine soja]